MSGDSCFYYNEESSNRGSLQSLLESFSLVDHVNKPDCKPFKMTIKIYTPTPTATATAPINGQASLSLLFPFYAVTHSHLDDRVILFRKDLSMEKAVTLSSIKEAEWFLAKFSSLIYNQKITINIEV